MLAEKTERGFLVQLRIDTEAGEKASWPPTSLPPNSFQVFPRRSDLSRKRAVDRVAEFSH
jgi:hypothetical protein